MLRVPSVKEAWRGRSELDEDEDAASGEAAPEEPDFAETLAVRRGSMLGERVRSRKLRSR